MGEPDSDDVFAVSPLLILPSTSCGFRAFLKQRGNLVLYTDRGDALTEEHRQRLVDQGVKAIYVETGDKEGFQRYLQRHLGRFLDDTALSVEQKAQVWTDTTSSMVEEVFRDNLPANKVTARHLERIKDLVATSARFISDPKALKELSRFVTRGFSLYRHGIGVMILTSVVLGTYDEADELLQTACSLGALLHDIGKSGWPTAMREKNPDDYTPEDWTIYRSHPTVGVLYCTRLPLVQESINCILFHHERLDGEGFPAGALGNAIPFYGKVVSVCDAYDNMTRSSPWGPRMTPFQALKRIKDQPQAFDGEAMRRLVKVLSDADIVG